jgi:hypothetical protein
LRPRYSIRSERNPFALCVPPFLAQLARGRLVTLSLAAGYTLVRRRQRLLEHCIWVLLGLMRYRVGDTHPDATAKQYGPPAASVGRRLQRGRVGRAKETGMPERDRITSRRSLNPRATASSFRSTA